MDKFFNQASVDSGDFFDKEKCCVTTIVKIPDIDPGPDRVCCFSVERGSFTLNAEGTEATINESRAFEPTVIQAQLPLAVPPVPLIVSITIPTLKRLRLGFFNVLEINNDPTYGLSISDGRSDGIINNCINIGSTIDTDNQIFCIKCIGSSVGWKAQVLAAGITNTSYDILFTQVFSIMVPGGGLNISGQWHGNMSNG